MRPVLCFCFLAGSVLITGCSFNLVYSENFKTLKQDIGYRTPKPIARELKYVYSTGTIIDNKPKLLVASNVTDPAALKIRAVDGWTNITGVEFNQSNQKRIITTSGTRARAVVAPTIASGDGRTKQLRQTAEGNVKDARAASAKGDHLQSRLLSEQAIVNEQMAQFNQSMNSSIQMMHSFTGAYASLAELGKALHKADGAYLANWVTTKTGAIGEEAPKGSVLHIDFLHALKGKSFNFASDGDLIVAVTLERADGSRLQAARGIKLVVLSGKDAGKVPLGFVAATEVPYSDAEARGIDSGDYNIPAYLHQFAVLIRSTMKDLYGQLEKR